MGTYICAHSSLREEHFGDRFAFTCNGCRELGYGTCYTCTNNSCNYHLHSACHSAPPTMSHPFFKQGQFVLEKTMLPPPPPNYYNHHHQGLENLCVACGTSVHGWRYVLPELAINGGYNTIFLHPCCMTLPHPNLYMKLEKVNCVHCQSTGVGNEGNKGWAYVEKDVAVHVKCMKDMLHKDWERRYYAPEHGQTSYGGTATQQRGLGRGANRGGGQGLARRRKRDYLFSGLEALANVLGLLNTLGLLDVDSIKEALVDFAEKIWGN